MSGTPEMVAKGAVATAGMLLAALIVYVAGASLRAVAAEEARDAIKNDPRIARIEARVDGVAVQLTQIRQELRDIRLILDRKQERAGR